MLAQFGFLQVILILMLTKSYHGITSVWLHFLEIGYLGDLYSLDPTSIVWICIAPGNTGSNSIPSRRYRHGFASDRGKLYLSAGLDDCTCPGNIALKTWIIEYVDRLEWQGFYMHGYVTVLMQSNSDLIFSCP